MTKARIQTPYMPFYVDDYEAATAHLTVEEDGIYMRLMRLCWRNSDCSIPDDPAWIIRRLRVSDDIYERSVKLVIEEFFTCKNGRVFQKRLCEEKNKILTSIYSRKKAGSKGGAAKALKTKEKEPSNATILLQAKSKQCPSIQNHTQNHNQLPTIVANLEGGGASAPAPPKSQPRATRLPENWTVTKADFEYAKGKGLAEIEIQTEAEKFYNYWTGKAGKDATKTNWQRTWQNWVLRAVERGGQPKTFRERDAENFDAAFR